MSTAKRIVVAALAGLVLLYAAWFGQRAEWVALAVFALPAIVLALAVVRRRVQAGFWAGVLALAWFSHGIMVAWTRPAEAAFAMGEVALSLVVVLAASLPGLRSRFRGKH